MNKNIPYRFSERSFRRYEPFLKKFHESNMEDVMVRFEDISINTAVARCRDALNAWKYYKYPTNWPISELVRKRRMFSITSVEDCLVLTQEPKNVRVEDSVRTEILSQPNKEQIKQVAKLVHIDHFRGICNTLECELIASPVEVDISMLELDLDEFREEFPTLDFLKLNNTILIS